MTREIKFRVWTGIQMEYKIMAGYLGAFYVQGIDEKDSACMSRMNSRYHPETIVMPMLPHKDASGKEIYAGDCYRTQDEETGDENVWVFVWISDLSMFAIVSPTEYMQLAAGWEINEVFPNELPDPIQKRDCEDHKVIQNIYEKPELLKQ